MPKKILIGVLILVIIGAGAYAIFHKSSSTPKTSTVSSPGAPAPTNQTQPTVSSNLIQTKTASSVGQYLADASGNTLYTNAGDTKGVSNCSGSCLYSWPIYSPSSSSSSLPANVTIINRSDGSKQYAYKDMPLYTFNNDSVGQVNGNNVSNFHVAKP